MEWKNISEVTKFKRKVLTGLRNVNFISCFIILYLKLLWKEKLKDNIKKPHRENIEVEKVIEKNEREKVVASMYYLLRNHGYIWISEIPSINLILENLITLHEMESWATHFYIKMYKYEKANSLEDYFIHSLRYLPTLNVLVCKYENIQPSSGCMNC